MNDWLEAERLADQAAELFESGRVAEAEEAIRQAIEIDGDRAEWHHQLGVVLQISARPAEAISSFDAAVDLAPDEPEFLQSAAAACAAAGDLTAAACRLETAAKITQHNDMLWAQVIEAHAACGAHDEAESSFYLAETYLETSSPLCLIALGGSLAARKMWSRAEWCFEEAIRLDGSILEAHRRLADLKAATGARDEAMRVYERLVSEAPVEPALAISWSVLLAEEGRTTEAVEVLRSVLESDPANAGAHFQFGCMAMRQGHLQQAAMTFQIVRRLDRHHPTCDLALGECLIGLGQMGDARRLLAAAVQRIVESRHRILMASDLEAAGQLLLRASMPVEAADMLRMAVKHEETPSVTTLKLLARATYMAGDLDGGKVVSRQVLRREPDCVASLSNLALASLLQDQLGLSAAWIRRGLRRHPRDPALRVLRRRWMVAYLRSIVRRLPGLRRAQSSGTQSA